VTRIQPWRELASRALIDCRILVVEAATMESPVDRSVHEFYRFRAPDWAHVVPITVGGEIVMIRQFRYGSGEVSLEIPAGLIETGETAEVAARRECLEETGYRATELCSLGTLRPNPALFTNRLHSFYAPGVEPGAAIKQTATERTEVELVPLARVSDLLTSGAIDHALDAALLWRFLHEYDR
jgi:8-oxo-dGTP pyrophosphatase MutT (NUDIX family)